MCCSALRKTPFRLGVTAREVVLPLRATTAADEAAERKARLQNTGPSKADMIRSDVLSQTMASLHAITSRPGDKAQPASAGMTMSRTDSRHATRGPSRSRTADSLELRPLSTIKSMDTSTSTSVVDPATRRMQAAIEAAEVEIVTCIMDYEPCLK